MEQNNTEEVLPTAKQVEEVMLKKEEKASQKPESHVLDTYAGHFQIYSPVFDKAIEAMNKKGLIRLLKLLVKYPLEEQHLKALGKLEKDALKIGDQLLTDKYIMIIHSLGEMAQKEKALKELQKNTDKNNSENKELNVEVKEKNND